MGISLRPRRLRRYEQIVRVLGPHLAGNIRRPTGPADADVETDGEPDADARSFADDLERLGPTFVKLGQLLASRPDLLPPSYARALARLQDETTPIPGDQVDEILERELKVRPTHLFARFDSQPIGSASLGQVHRATMRSGRQVCVKVQRPDAPPQVLEDLEVLSELSSFLEEHVDRVRRYAVADLVEQFRRALVAELDYRREGANLRFIGDLLADRHRIVVPAPYEDYSTSRVLTMDYVPGRKVTDVGPLGRLEIDGAGLADELYDAYLTQVLDGGVFHSDPHPGNILVTPDGRLGLVDLGQVARVPPRIREQLVRLFVALGDGRADEVARILVGMGTALDGFDERAFERSVVDVVGRMQEPGGTLPAGSAVLELTRGAADAALRPAPELGMLGKVLVNLDEVAAALDPDFRPADVVRRRVPDAVRRSMSLTPGRLVSAALETREFAENLPGRINRAMDAVAGGHFQLRVEAFNEVEFLRGLHRLAHIAASGMVLAAVIVGSALLAQTKSAHLAGVVVFTAAIGTGVVGLAWTVGASRRARRRAGQR
jgi:ubiquinone biosynthesis protein